MKTRKPRFVRTLLLRLAVLFWLLIFALFCLTGAVILRYDALTASPASPTPVLLSAGRGAG